MNAVIPIMFHLDVKLAEELAEHLPKIEKTKKDFFNELVENYFINLKIKQDEKM